MSQRVLIFGQKFAALRRARYMTQEEFAQQIGMSAANVRRLEQNTMGGMQSKNFRRLAGLLKLTPDELFQRIGAAPSLDEDVVRASAGALTAVAYAEVDLPSSILGGSLKPAVEIERFHGVSAARPEDRAGVERGTTLAPAGSSGRFSAVVDGDCMEPQYRSGDVVIFSVDVVESEGILDGRNYFIQFDDGQNTFKRLSIDPADRDMLVLSCWNESYPSRTVNRQQVQLVARAIYKLVPDASGD